MVDEISEAATQAAAAVCQGGHPRRRMQIIQVFPSGSCIRPCASVNTYNATIKRRTRLLGREGN